MLVSGWEDSRSLHFATLRPGWLFLFRDERGGGRSHEMLVSGWEDSRSSWSAGCRLRWLKSSEQHGQDKHRRGSFGYAQDRLFDSAPPSAVSRDKSVRRSAQDDGFVASWRCKKA